MDTKSSPREGRSLMWEHKPSNSHSTILSKRIRFLSSELLNTLFHTRLKKNIVIALTVYFSHCRKIPQLYTFLHSQRCLGTNTNSCLSKSMRMQWHWTHFVTEQLSRQKQKKLSLYFFLFPSFQVSILKDLWCCYTWTLLFAGMMKAESFFSSLKAFSQNMLWQNLG